MKNQVEIVDDFGDISKTGDQTRVEEEEEITRAS